MDATELQRQYDDAGSIRELARRFDVPYPSMRYRLVRAGIALRSTGYASPRTVPMKRGAEHHNWKGGVIPHGDGYLMEYAPDHPAAVKGYVLQHRLVMERTLGRYLTADEDVHHLDENKGNNDPDNLVLKHSVAHRRDHKASAPRDEKGRFV